MTDVQTDAGAEISGAVIEAAEAPPLEGKALLDAVAHEMGWRPKDKWRGDPEKWRDSDDFLKASPGAWKAKNEEIARTNRAAQKAIEKAREQAIADAEAKIAAAAAAGDKDAAAEATRELKEASKTPDPGFQEFVNRNPWFMEHDEARALAIAAAEKSFKLGKSDAEQRADGEAAVRKRFPELFDDEAPAPEPKKGPPAVEGGQRSASPAPRKRGWSDLPAAIRQQVTPKILKTFGQTEAEYAESYFAENA